MSYKHVTKMYAGKSKLQWKPGNEKREIELTGCELSFIKRENLREFGNIGGVWLGLSVKESCYSYFGTVKFFCESLESELLGGFGSKELGGDGGKARDDRFLDWNVRK